MVLDLLLRLKSIISPKNKIKSMLNQTPSIEFDKTIFEDLKSKTSN